MPTVLVIEDDSAIRRGLVDALAFAGYDVLESGRGEAAVDLVTESPVDVVLLDVMLPEMDGFEVLQHLRRCQPTLPVIMVTARGAEEDRVHGLTTGADDYVVKPFSARELLARVEAVLRRSPERSADVHRLRMDGLLIDLRRQEAQTQNGAETPLRLTEREVAILRYLAMHRSRAVDRRELLHRVWGLDPRGLHTRTVDMHVARLREKLHHPELIQTVRGKGYMLCDSVQVEGP